MRLGKVHSSERLEKAAERALACRSHSYGSVASILEKKLESQPLPTITHASLPSHENIRGSSYFDV
jgi:hypothetical protein